MKKAPAFLHFCLVTVLLLAGFQSLSAEDTYPLREAVECNPRKGLPNFLNKVENGQAVKVAYLGGSITAAPGWRILSREWLAETYPDAAFEEIHAAIGGTGSDLGVFRVERDVLQHKPDLLFVEFAVNDGGAPPERIHQSMEGIVRQTWRADPGIDICFVYTVKEDFLKDLQAGKMPRAASAMEELADWYGIPSIHFGVEVAALEKAGELIFTAPKPENPAKQRPMVFSSDSVHPLVETGHRLYVEAIERSWPAIKSASGEKAPHELSAPLREDNWEAAKMLPINEDMLKGPWEHLAPDHPLASRFQRNLPELYQASGAGASLQFEFTGTYAGIFDLLGPDGGQLSITLDDQEPRTLNLIDGYCTYHRMSKFAIGSDLEPGLHKVSVELTGTKLDKRNILFEKNREYYDTHQDRYEDHTWYAGALMIIGDLK